MSLEAFQKSHGAEWTRQANSPAFLGAMSLVANEQLNYLKALRSEDIRDNGTAILAEFVGFLKHEAKLMEIPQRTEEPLGDLGEPTYPTPEEELEDLIALQNRGRPNGYTGSPDLTPEAFRAEEEKPIIRRRRKRRKRTRKQCPTPPP